MMSRLLLQLLFTILCLQRISLPRTKLGEFGTIKITNSSCSKIVGIGDVCIKSNVDCMVTLKDVQHVLKGWLMMLLARM